MAGTRIFLDNSCEARKLILFTVKIFMTEKCRQSYYKDNWRKAITCDCRTAMDRFAEKCEERDSWRTTCRHYCSFDPARIEK